VMLVNCLQTSFARYMSGQGFDTWILEVRGSGFSTQGMDFKEVGQPLDAMLDSSVKLGMDGVFPLLSIEKAKRLCLNLVT